jgi:sugar lactone lactonase YvrE
MTQSNGIREEGREGATGANLPEIASLYPACAMPFATVDAIGKNLGPSASRLPSVTVDAQNAHLLESRAERITFRVPGSATTGEVIVSNHADGTSKAVPLRVARELTDGLHPITSPVVSASGMIFTTISGSRGKQTPVSVVRVSPDGRGTPFVTDIMNASGLAISPTGELFVTSRAEGTIYQVDPAGQTMTYAEGLGIATGTAFDANGDLFVGDRSGTIFRVNKEQQIFVHATIEPSVSAFHLAVNAQNELLVTAPTLSSNECIWRIDALGEKHIFYQGLGRPQGLAVDAEGDVYVAASLHGRRGIVRIPNKPNAFGAREAELVLSGLNLVGLAFSPLGTTILASNQAIFEIDLGVEGLRLY